VVRALDDVSFDVHSGETLGLVGESGSGKSLTALAILGLLPPQARIVRGSIHWRGRDLPKLSPAEMQKVRGAEIGLVVQEPLGALNPVLTVGDQLIETLLVHRRAATRQQAAAQAVQLLGSVQLKEPEGRLSAYPHQLSGGERQRVVLALALAPRPQLVIADEPTTALDVITQAEILELLKALRRELDMALLVISHDLAVVAECADRVAVMHGGRVVEQGPTDQVLRAPQHHYTRELTAAFGDFVTSDP
jgi:ABC-type dipeptide/oligopeptide/nickel transport system ATPase component